MSRRSHELHSRRHSTLSQEQETIPEALLKVSLGDLRETLLGYDLSTNILTNERECNFVLFLFKVCLVEINDFK